MLAGVLRELVGLGVKGRGHGSEQKLGLWSVEIKSRDPGKNFFCDFPSCKIGLTVVLRPWEGCK